MTLLHDTLITIAPLVIKVEFALHSVFAWTTEGLYSEVLEQQAAMHANYSLVKLYACSVRYKQDQDMNAGCTSPLNMGLSFLACALEHSSGCTADLPSAHPEPPFCCWPSSAAPQAACNTHFGVSGLLTLLGTLWTKVILQVYNHPESICTQQHCSAG